METTIGKAICANWDKNKGCLNFYHLDDWLKWNYNERYLKLCGATGETPKSLYDWLLTKITV
jgi:hypothetical protein